MIIMIAYYLITAFLLALAVFIGSTRLIDNVRLRG